MTDEEAIKILSHTTNLGYGVVIETMEGYTTRDIKIALDMAIEALGVRPQGEWIIKFDSLECPFCGMSIDDEVHWLYPNEFNFNFCPNCGAQMKTRTDAD